MKFISALTIAVCAVLVSAAPNPDRTDVNIHDNKSEKKYINVDQNQITNQRNSGILTGLLGNGGVSVLDGARILSSGDNRDDHSQKTKIDA